MSLGYAEKLSYREDLGGQLGAPEHFDSPEELDAKITRLAELVQNSKRIVAFTGAGISTSCGIPDFRGPSGIWTLQRQGKPLPRPKVSFTVARPSFAHAALVSLMDSGKLTYVVSQNVDGLHLRSGIPRHRIAELHGNCFSERCSKCNTEYIRDFEIETVGFKKTGRRCTKRRCGGALHDHILDWEDALPEDELEESETHAKEADLAICLGTSLQITPACNLPLKTIRKYKNKPTAGTLVIINLQKTQHDKKAEASGGLVIRAKADDVMRRLMAKLETPVPPYKREDVVIVRHKLLDKESGDGAGGLGTLKVEVHSRHGPECALPILRSASFRFKGDDRPVLRTEPPFEAHRRVDSHEDCLVSIELELDMATAGASSSRVALVHDDAAKAVEKGEREWRFVSQVVHYHDPAALQHHNEVKEEENGSGGEREEKRPRPA